MNETARWCRALLVAGALAGAVRVAPAQEPPVPNRRTMAGGSLIVVGTPGFNAPMLAARATWLNGALVAPDITAGVYLHNTAELVAVDAGIGTSVPFKRTGAFTISGGPSLLVAATGGGRQAVPGVHARMSLVAPFDLNLGLRFEVGGNLYGPGQYATRLWFFGVGITTLGIRF